MELSLQSLLVSGGSIIVFGMVVLTVLARRLERGDKASGPAFLEALKGSEAKPESAATMSPRARWCLIVIGTIAVILGILAAIFGEDDGSSGADAPSAQSDE